MKNSKYYRNAYNNPSQYDYNKIVSAMESSECSKTITILSEQWTALRHAKRDKENGTYKFI